MIAKGSIKYTEIDNQWMIVDLNVMDNQIKATLETSPSIYFYIK
jgi:hypothetical protein